MNCRMPTILYSILQKRVYSLVIDLSPTLLRLGLVGQIKVTPIFPSMTYGGRRLDIIILSVGRIKGRICFSRTASSIRAEKCVSFWPGDDKGGNTGFYTSELSNANNFV